MLGVALGLVAYYSLTSLLARHAQTELRESVEDVPTFVEPAPEELVQPTGPTLDWTGYEEQDLAYWEALPTGAVLGRLVIPALDLDTMVVKGAELPQLRKGPGWISWTDLPGPTGRCGVSAHRSTYSGPFQHLERLEKDDTVDVYSPYRRYRYRVTGTRIVAPTAVEVVDSTEEPSLALTACHPPWGNAYRMVVEADLVEASLITDAED